MSFTPTCKGDNMNKAVIKSFVLLELIGFAGGYFVKRRTNN